MAAFKKQLMESPSNFTKSILVVDEGDTILERVVNQALSNPKHLVLLSAVPREAWNGTQRLCFNSVKGRKGNYLDASCVFPMHNGGKALEPELLPESPAEILKLALKLSKQ